MLFLSSTKFPYAFGFTDLPSIHVSANTLKPLSLTPSLAFSSALLTFSKQHTISEWNPLRISCNNT